MKEAQNFRNTDPEAIGVYEVERRNIFNGLGLDPDTATLRDIMVVRAAQKNQLESNKK